MRSKPGFWRPTREATDPTYRVLWDDLAYAMPWVEQLDIGNNTPLPVDVVGRFTSEWVDAFWDPVVTPLGRGWVGVSGLGSSSGLFVDDPNAGFRLGPENTGPAAAAAMVFSWDGTTGDERALISQNSVSGTDLRIRISNNASPANLEQVFQSADLITGGIVADRWYLLVVSTQEPGVAGQRFKTALVDLETGERQDGSQSTTGSAPDPTGGEPVLFGGEVSNDPAVGVTVLSAWLWDRRLNDADIDLMGRDPWGMFRPALWPFFPAGVSTPFVFFDVTDLPSDFDTAETATITVRYRGQNYGSGTINLYAQLFRSDETTTMSDEILVATVTADSSFANTAPVVFTGLDTAADKTVWDSARLRLRWG